MNPVSAETPRIKAVVFDLDGLMFNTEDVFHAAGRELLRRRGLELTEQLQTQMMGRRAHESFQILIETTGLRESAAELMAESQEIFDSLLETSLAPMPGLFELLDHVEQRQLPKGVATSSGRDYLQRLLGRFELAQRFGVLLCGEDVARGKPHPEIYLKAAEQLRVSPQQMLVLEDSQTGTQAAALAQAVVVSVPHEHSRFHDFSPAVYVADGLNDPRLWRLIGE